MISREEFLKFSAEEIAQRVRADGPQVCVFPINGTRRWFMLEYGHKIQVNSAQMYMELAGKRHIELYQMCFNHGLDTLLTPVLGSKHLLRGDKYMEKIGAESIARLATHPDYLTFYKKYRVRVHFYGNYRNELAATPFAYLSSLIDNITKQTAHNDQYRIFYGVFANDATEAIAHLSVMLFQKTGRVPTREELIELYYGEYVEPASLFIGFSKLKAYDYPLLGVGEEDLYFTIAPSLYLNETQLRNILYDHIYSRRVGELDYAEMIKQDLLAMRSFYRANHENTLGVGEIRGEIWYPTTQVQGLT